MKRSLLTAAAMLLMATTAQAADSEYTSGNWTVYYIAKNDQNQSMCGLQTTLPNGGQIMMKSDETGSVFVHIYKYSWSLPVGITVPMKIGFDREYHFTAPGTTFEISSTKTRGIAFQVGSKHIGQLLNLLKNSRNMWLGFEQGNEPAWRADMTGSAETVARWSRCTLALWEPSKPPQATQPYGESAAPPQATQPYSKQTPTQPYGKSGTPAQRPTPAKRDDGSV